MGLGAILQNLSIEDDSYVEAIVVSGMIPTHHFGRRHCIHCGDSDMGTGPAGARYVSRCSLKSSSAGLVVFPILNRLFLH